jgi:antitoxin HicB
MFGTNCSTIAFVNTGKDLSYYLALPYTIELVREDESTWFARVPELPGCMTEGNSPSEAAEMIYDAMSAWLEVALADGQPVPEPRAVEAYSGKFVVRVSKSLHRDLVAAAEREDVSLNQYVVTELARAVGRAQARCDLDSNSHAGAAAQGGRIVLPPTRIPNEVTRRTFAETDAGQSVAPCESAEDMISLLGV